MIIIPFIFFTLLTAFWWIKHRGLDVCVYMSALYAITTLFGLWVVYGDMLGEGGILFDNYDVTLGVIPTFLFCTLITLGIFPFSLIFNKEIKQIKYSPSLFLDGFCYFLFFVFLINLYLIVDSTVEILSGDLSSVRSDHNEGILSPAEVKAESMPIIFRYILYFNTATILGLPLFFYYSCCKKKQLWFKIMLLAISLSKPLVGIQAADRTELTFYGLMLIFCLIFFWTSLSSTFKRRLALIGTPFVAVSLIYLIAVSQARFSDKSGSNDKAFEAALQYAGQNYLNFCFFWEKGKFDYLTPERTFPYYSYVVLHIESNPERRGERSGQQGFFISVFATYIGDILLDLSPIGAIIWAVFFFLLCLAIIRYAHREEYDIGDVLVIFVLATVPIFGVFYYRYYSAQYFYLFLSTAIIYFLSKKQIIYQ